MLQQNKLTTRRIAHSIHSCNTRITICGKIPYTHRNATVLGNLYIVFLKTVQLICRCTEPIYNASCDLLPPP